MKNYERRQKRKQLSPIKETNLENIISEDNNIKIKLIRRNSIPKIGTQALRFKKENNNKNSIIKIKINDDTNNVINSNSLSSSNNITNNKLFINNIGNNFGNNIGNNKLNEKYKQRNKSLDNTNFINNNNNFNFDGDNGDYNSNNKGNNLENNAIHNKNSYHEKIDDLNDFDLDFFKNKKKSSKIEIKCKFCPKILQEKYIYEHIINYHKKDLSEKDMVYFCMCKTQEIRELSINTLKTLKKSYNKAPKELQKKIWFKDFVDYGKDICQKLLELNEK